MVEGGTVTLLFTDLVGSTELYEQLGDEGAERLRRTHFRLIRDVVADRGGQEVKNLGDGLMIAFASAVEGVRAAVEIQRAVERHNVQPDARMPVQLAVRVGLHIGEPIQEEDDYFGTPVVVARRLCDSAGPCQILVSDLVQLLVKTRGEFALHDAGLYALKGLAEPVAAWEVEWREAAPEQVALPPALAIGARLPFVGRERHLDVIWARWERSRDGEPGLALIAGEPGIGKTRLAAEVAARAHDKGAVVLFGHSDEDTLIPYQPFVEALDRLIRELPAEQVRAHAGEAAPELARLVPAVGQRLPGLAPPVRAEPESERWLQFEAVSAFLASVSRTTPTLLVLDDLHWADKPTLLLLQHLFRAVGDAGLLVLGTYRDTDLDRHHPLAAALADLRRQVGYDRVALEGLDEDAIVEFLDLLTGQEPPREFCQAVQQQTEGNPFFVGEVLRHLVEAGAVSVEDGEWVATDRLAEVGIPEGIKEVIGRRLSRLSDDANTVLAVAAVTGREFDLEVVERSCGLDGDAVLRTLDEAITARLVLERAGAPMGYRFSHALVRETLYDELTTARRVHLHHRVAEAIEALHVRRPPLGVLAHHWAEAAAGGDVSRAVEYAQRAGEEALGLLAFEEAAVHYERAVALLELADPRDAALEAELLIVLADARLKSGDETGSYAAADRAVESARAAGDPDLLGRAALARYGNWVAGMTRPEVQATLEEALAALPDTDSALRAKLLACLGSELYFTERLPEARRVTTEALDLALRLGDVDVIAWVAGPAGNRLDRPEDAPERHRVYRELIERVSGTGDLQALAWLYRDLVMSQVMVGDREGLESSIAAHTELAARSRLPALQWVAPMWRAALAVMDGRLAEAEDRATEAVTLGQKGEEINSFQMFGVQLFAIRREQGRLQELEDGVRAMIDQFPAVPAWRAALALLFAESGHQDEARAALAELKARGPERFPTDGNWLIGMAVITDAAALTGDGEIARGIDELVLPCADLHCNVGMATDWYGSVHRMLGELALLDARPDDAVRHFESGIDADLAVGGTRMVVRGKWGLARALLARDDTDRAAEVIVTGLALAETRELPVLADRLRALV